MYGRRAGGRCSPSRHGPGWRAVDAAGRGSAGQGARAPSDVESEARSCCSSTAGLYPVWRTGGNGRGGAGWCDFCNISHNL